jgi:hypothetical protein
MNIILSPKTERSSVIVLLILLLLVKHKEILHDIVKKGMISREDET